MNERKPYFRIWGQLTQPVVPESQHFYDTILNADAIPKDGDKRGVKTSADGFTTSDKKEAEQRLTEMRNFVTATGHSFEFTIEEYFPE